MRRRGAAWVGGGRKERQTAYRKKQEFPSLPCSDKRCERIPWHGRRRAMRGRRGMADSGRKGRQTAHRRRQQAETVTASPPSAISVPQRKAPFTPSPHTIQTTAKRGTVSGKRRQQAADGADGQRQTGALSWVRRKKNRVSPLFSPCPSDGRENCVAWRAAQENCVAWQAAGYEGGTDRDRRHAEGVEQNTTGIALALPLSERWAAQENCAAWRRGGFNVRRAMRGGRAAK